VIELEHHDVRFAAVDAGMLRQVIEDEPAIARCVFIGQSVTPDTLDLNGAAIVFAEVLVLTRFAVRCAASALLPIELIERLFFLTTRANFHALIVAFRCANTLASSRTRCYNTSIGMQTTPRLPTGTVTFLFCDIQGSTTLWARTPHAMSAAVAMHDALFREVISAHDGVIFKTVGDEVCSVFGRADQAISAAVEVQRRLPEQHWPEETGLLHVRMGIHTGQAIERDNDYFGPALNRVARVMSVAHGGQVVTTRSTAAVVEGILDASIRFRDLGVHHLKGLTEPEAIYQILAPGLQFEFPPLTSSDQHANNIPTQISSFVGRTSELAALSDLTQYHRLLTIVGPGGIGKTRIALQLATEVLSLFPDGAWLIELAPLNDGKLIAQTIGDTFRLKEEPHQTIDDQLIDYLHSKKLLLVLDNSEHLLAETAAVAKKLLSRCPGLVIVTTSREPLHLTGEHVFRLPPLGLPTPDGPRDAPPADSVLLFIERARAVRPATVLAAADREIAASICSKLEGIPLAIELAAARIVTLPLPDLDSAWRKDSRS